MQPRTVMEDPQRLRGRLGSRSEAHGRACIPSSVQQPQLRLGKQQFYEPFCIQRVDLPDGSTPWTPTEKRIKDGRWQLPSGERRHIRRLAATGGKQQQHTKKRAQTAQHHGPAHGRAHCHSGAVARTAACACSGRDSRAGRCQPSRHRPAEQRKPDTHSNWRSWEHEGRGCRTLPSS